MLIQWNIFGSKNSIDYDIMVKVDSLPKTIKECHRIVSSYNIHIGVLFHSLKYKPKKINCNICEVNNGIVTNVFKGTCDEVNNCLIETYKNHKDQLHPPLVWNKVDRDVELKVLRCYRILLSFLSRTDDRISVKKALSGNLVQKINVLNTLYLCNGVELGDRNVAIKDFYKILAFQIGQTIALMKGIELYTKFDIDDYYVYGLNNALHRHDMNKMDYCYLEALKKELIKITLTKYKHILPLNEKSYLI